MNKAVDPDNGCARPNRAGAAHPTGNGSGSAPPNNGLKLTGRGGHIMNRIQLCAAAPRSLSRSR